MNYDGIRRPIQLQTVNGPSNIVGFEHSYDPENNKVNERKLHDPTNSELYQYDSAYRLTNFERGTLNAGGTTVTAQTSTTDALQDKDWTLDGVDNWQSVVGLSAGAEGNFQTANRLHTNFNEIFSVGGNSLPGEATSGEEMVPSANFNNDNNGNQLVAPKPEGSGGRITDDRLLFT